MTGVQTCALPIYDGVPRLRFADETHPFDPFDPDFHRPGLHASKPDCPASGGDPSRPFVVCVCSLTVAPSPHPLWLGLTHCSNRLQRDRDYATIITACPEEFPLSPPQALPPFLLLGRNPSSADPYRPRSFFAPCDAPVAGRTWGGSACGVGGYAVGLRMIHAPARHTASPARHGTCARSPDATRDVDRDAENRLSLKTLLHCPALTQTRIHR